MRAAKLREIFADYAASVEIGLRRYQEEGRRKSGLLKKLVDRYGDTQEGRRQLALAFTLLDDQPLELLSSLLSSLQLDACICVVVNSCQLTIWLKVILISQVRRLKLVQLPRLQLYTKHMIIHDIAKLQLLIYPIWMFFACCFPSWFFSCLLFLYIVLRTLACRPFFPQLFQITWLWIQQDYYLLRNIQYGMEERDGGWFQVPDLILDMLCFALLPKITSCTFEPSGFFSINPTNLDLTNLRYVTVAILIYIFIFGFQFVNCLQTIMYMYVICTGWYGMVVVDLAAVKICLRFSDCTAIQECLRWNG